jgi:hypothetical protein
MPKNLSAILISNAVQTVEGGAVDALPGVIATCVDSVILIILSTSRSL